MSMKIGVPKEVHEGERRVALTPAVAQQIQKFGYTLAIESGAGDHADFDDASYANAGSKCWVRRKKSGTVPTSS